MSRKIRLFSRLRGGLLVVAAVAGWISAVPIFAAPTSDMARPMVEIEAGLARLLGCQWQGNDTYAMCPIKRIEGAVALTRDPAGRSVETVEMSALLAGRPQPRPDDEKLSRDTVLRVVAYLLPSWQASPAWLTTALSEAHRGKAWQVIKVDSVTVLVQRLQFADVDDTIASIVITRKTSLNEWK